mmetsp:Transcript_64106/g.164973  ORF Transcript_64106/g.164973 Transcript_64106/m.164973 type:complete len:482 (+) Transcript_64106:55-1500(+)
MATYAPQDLQQAESQGLPPVPLEQFLDKLSIGYFHLRLLFLCGLGFAAAGIEVGLVSFLFPELRRSWDLNEYQLSMLPTLTALASNVGEISCGLLADKYGRRPVFVVTSLFVAVFGMLSAASPNIGCLIVLRMVVGFAFGGNIAVDFALFSEFIPTRGRGLMLFAMAAFWPLGQLMASVLAWWTIPRYGWRGFLVATSVPMMLTACLRPLMPESPRWLLLKGHRGEATEVCRHMAEHNGVDPRQAGLAPGVTVVLEGEGAPLVPKLRPGGFWNLPVFELFGPVLRRTTLAVMMFGTTLEVGGYALVTLLPTYLVSRGMESTTAYATMTLHSTMQFVGIALATIVATYVGRLLPMRGVSLLIPLSVIGASWVRRPMQIMAWACLGAACQEGGWSLFHVYTPEAFPTELRASAIGIISAAASFFSFLVPIGTAWLLEHFETGTAILVLGCITILSGAVAGFLLHVETLSKPLEDVKEASAKHG